LKDFKPLRIFLAGHEGMVGQSILRSLQTHENHEIIIAKKSEVNLTNQSEVNSFFDQNQIDEVYIAAAKVGGIYANNAYPADFIYQNTMIQSNVIHAAHTHNINKLLFLGSSCIYPVHADQPIRESSLLSGALETSNQAYAVAKIAGIEMCHSYNVQYARDYRCVMPTNLYGPNDNFHPSNSHVIPGLISKFYTAVESNHSEVVIWGTGIPQREFLHVDDLARACIFTMQLPRENFASSLQNNMPHINIGSGNEVSIKELAEILAKISGFKGNIIYDASKLDGAPRKLLDSSKIKELGWRSEIPLSLGLKSTYDWFINHQDTFRSGK
jgi:GDP-L-fucose synthase